MPITPDSKIDVTPSSAFNLGTSDFTIECFFKAASTPAYEIFYGDHTTGGSIYISLNETYAITAEVKDTNKTHTVTLTSGTTGDYGDSTWRHLAFVRNSSIFTLYIDGTSVATATDATFTSIDLSSATTLQAGAVAGSTSTLYLDEFRISDIARYTSNFTAPITAFPNVGAAPHTFQGSNYGYISGGSTGTIVNTIDKFSFSIDGNATDVGDLSTIRTSAAGQSSSTYGYTSGGYGTARVNTIDKFSFSTDGNATDIGDLTVIRQRPAGQSSSTYGYTSGGDTGADSSVIDKFSFSTDGNATDVGDLTIARDNMAGQSSTTYGYTSGDTSVAGTIDKFSFSTDGNATDVGDLTVAREGARGQSSSTYGYTSGGSTGTIVNTIDKFSFSTDGNATDVGDLTIARTVPATQSSVGYGYTSGGSTGTVVNTIDKFSFSTDGNATDVGDLTVARDSSAGQQY